MKRIEQKLTSILFSHNKLPEEALDFYTNKCLEGKILICHKAFNKNSYYNLLLSRLKYCRRGVLRKLLSSYQHIPGLQGSDSVACSGHILPAGQTPQ